MYWGDRTPKKYRLLRDPDGVPYCSAEGLEEWAEYVATDEDGTCEQYRDKPKLKVDYWYSPVIKSAPDHFANTHDHWTQTLRRVWRPESQDD